MPINLDEAIGAELPPVEFSWTSSDVQLYHLGLGAGADPMDPRELRYLIDGTPQVLPTFGNVAQSFHMTEPPAVKFPGIDIELSRVLHASEAISAPGPIPASGTGTAITRFTDIWDKGKAAVIWSETEVTAPDGTVLWTQKRSIFARGEGGFGGERGPSVGVEIPEREPDLDIEIGLPLGDFDTHRRAALATEPAFTTGEDRSFLGPQHRAVGRGDLGLRPNHRSFALIPDIGEPGDRSAGARRGNGSRRTDRLAGVQHPRQFDIDTGELDRGRFGHVETLGDIAEGGQHLRRAVDEVTQLARIHRVRACAQAEMVELHIRTGPREFDRRQFRADGLVEIDRHPQPFPAICSAAR